MQRVHRTLTFPVVLAALSLAGCDDQPTQPSALPTPQFAQSEGNGGPFDFQPLATSAVCRVPTSDAAYRPYDLPAGFSQTIIADEIGDFRPVAGTGADLPDMVTLNETGPPRSLPVSHT